MEKAKHDQSYAIIICDGLVNARINPASPYSSAKTSIGPSEMARLLGFGKNYGNGPLPTFLQAATKAARDGSKIGVILLQESQENAASNDSHEFEQTFRAFPPQFEDICTYAHLVKTEPCVIPWAQVEKNIEYYLSKVPRQTKTQIRFLVVGCNTEGRPLAIATHLKNGLGYHNVAVCSHLIGSSGREAHFAALRHIYPTHGVKVILNLTEAGNYIGLDYRSPTNSKCIECAVEPLEIKDMLEGDRLRIVELLCMHWTKCRLRPLAGGFSGSFLFVAEGWKNDVRTEPMVIKIDNFQQMRREIAGYNEVKDILGKHIPQFGYPIVVGQDVGVGMELATMDGKPQTLQDTFEEADFEGTFSLFINRFERALSLISKKLYKNTLKNEVLSPYHRFGLKSNKESRYLQDNGAIISSYLQEVNEANIKVNVEQLPKILQMVASNDDGIESETCLAHGDLNLQNIICDNADNVWFIDWTHCGRHPIELDFAKLENDIKFVVSKEFELEDIPNLQKFEDYLLSHRLPVEEKEMPDHLKFVKWDLRYRKILSTVSIIRREYFSIKQGAGWLAYRIALLKYSIHTLSFDKSRGRGECDLQQLAYALYSSEKLLLDLVIDDFHLKIRGGRPLSYPARQRISIDYAPWRFDCPEYSPPYYVSSEVLKNACDMKKDGWADPENFSDALTDIKSSDTKNADDNGRPRHPMGRTGIAGRGSLGRWGKNPAVNGVIIKAGKESNSYDILLGSRGDSSSFWLPRGFVLHDQSNESAIQEAIRSEFGFDCDGLPVEMIYKGFSYDERQTDHAWVEITSFLFCCVDENCPKYFNHDRKYDVVDWHTLNSNSLDTIHPSQVISVSNALKKLEGKVLSSTRKTSQPVKV